MARRLHGILVSGVLAASLATMSACSETASSSDDDDGSGSGGASNSTGVGAGVDPATLPILGNGQHTADSVSIVEIANSADGLAISRDVAFNPLAPNQLWVLNRADDSMVIIIDPGTPQQTSAKYQGFGGEHFMVQGSALAFGDNGFMATIHEEDEITQPQTPADFMGPTLWTTDINEFEGGHASHYDMLHNSPNGMGIAWQQGNKYWVFDGAHSSLTSYDFVGDHGPGGADHTDGVVRRCIEGEVLWHENVPSHMEFDPATRTQLYVADTGHNRIAVLDTTTGTEGGAVFPNYDGTDQQRVNNAVATTLVDGVTIGMSLPSGLAIHGDHLYVSDNGNSTIWGFDMDGTLIDWLETGMPPGSLMGIEFDAEGRLYVADGLGNRVVRIEAL